MSPAVTAPALREVHPSLARLELYRRNFLLFAERELKIRPKGRAGVVPFTLYPFQRRLFEKWRAQESDIGYVRQVILKARQIGSSTMAQAYLFHRTALFKHTNTIIVAHDLGPARNIFEMAKTYYDHMAPDVRPQIRYSTRSELVFDVPTVTHKSTKGSQLTGLGSKVVIASARNMHGSRGFTFHNVQLSEAAAYPDPEEIEKATLSAVAQAPGTSVIIESTALPEGHWFYEMCQMAKSGSSQYRFDFISWAEDPSCRLVLLPDDVAMFDLDTDERALMKEYGLDLEQLKWRRHKLAETRGDLDAFHQEFPLEESEAWVLKGLNVFPLDQLRTVREGLRPPRFRANIVPFGHDLDRRIAHAHDGPLAVWETPEEGASYDIGVDVCMNREGGDWSVAEVLKRPTGEQVAEYRDRIEPGEFVELLDTLGRWYNVAQIAVEINGPGLLTNTNLSIAYPNLYVWRRVDRVDRKFSNYLGWETTSKNKRFLISLAKDRLYRYVTTDAWRRVAFVKSDRLHHELSTFVQVPGASEPRYAAAPNSHDDCVMAWMIGLIASSDHMGEDPFSLMPIPEIKPDAFIDPACMMTVDEHRTRRRQFAAVDDIEGWSL